MIKPSRDSIRTYLTKSPLPYEGGSEAVKCASYKKNSHAWRDLWSDAALGGSAFVLQDKKGREWTFAEEEEGWLLLCPLKVLTPIDSMKDFTRVVEEVLSASF